MKVLYSRTYSNLTVQMLGCHHDHCEILWCGLIKNIPEKYKSLITKSLPYGCVYKEDIPLKKRF